MYDLSSKFETLLLCRGCPILGLRSCHIFTIIFRTFPSSAHRSIETIIILRIFLISRYRLCHSKTRIRDIIIIHGSECVISGNKKIFVSYFNYFVGSCSTCSCTVYLICCSQIYHCDTDQKASIKFQELSLSYYLYFHLHTSTDSNINNSLLFYDSGNCAAEFTIKVYSDMGASFSSAFRVIT